MDKQPLKEDAMEVERDDLRIPLERDSGDGDISLGYEEIESDQVPETDIVFECPHCSKSLAIDQKGAGLLISCTACHQLVTVPIPEGMELSDIDITPEEQETQIVSMRRALHKNEARVEELETQIAALKEYRTSSELSRARSAHKFTELRALCGNLLRCQAELSGMIDKIQNIMAADE